MNWTDIFIRRPVLSMVVSALVLIFGLKAIGSLPVNQYPQTQNAIVTITTAYYGADPETTARVRAPRPVRPVGHSDRQGAVAQWRCDEPDRDAGTDGWIGGSREGSPRRRH